VIAVGEIGSSKPRRPVRFLRSRARSTCDCQAHCLLDRASPLAELLMSSSSAAPAVSGFAKAENVLTWTVLSLSMVLAFSVRLFSVLRYESVIHEFDPYFNYRSTQYLVNNGYADFHNWFDPWAWYPLGRVVGPTVYPGLMATSALFYHVLHFLHITIDIRNVCVFLAPFFSSLTVLAVYGLGKEAHSKGAGLAAAAFVSIVPGYISRSVAGSYDNEGIAIFCMLITFFLWVKAVKTGSMLWSGLAALGYFYMVSAWGGYVFIINMIPLHVLGLMVTGRFSHRVYVAYSTVYVLGTILSMQIQFVGFQAVQSSEHMAALGVFGLCQILAFVNYLKSVLTADQFNLLLRTVVLSAIGVAVGLAVLASMLGKIAPWTGRFYSLLDPTYAKEHIPIIASVSEHQPTTWSSFFFDLQYLGILFPVGLYYCFRKLNDGNMFMIIYGVAAVYFASVMVRLMLVLAPGVCVLGGIAVSEVFSTQFRVLRESESAAGATSSGAASSAASGASKTKKVGTYTKANNGKVALTAIALVTLMLGTYALHCTWVTSEAYSSPSIVLAAKGSSGRHIFDDFREAYFWLRQNTHEKAKVMSWWDYGYQITAMANRTILVDNNTWNNTHIATVGKAMSSTEDEAYKIMRKLDVDYVLVVFGGLVGYASDDINKFLWMVRIGGGVYPEIKEPDYYTPSGEFRIDAGGSQTLLNSLMYKLCYYRFGSMYTDTGMWVAERALRDDDDDDDNDDDNDDDDDENGC
jgi:dolichyl-diphosphooligosaccharide---protein glycosyltransferase